MRRPVGRSRLRLSPRKRAARRKRRRLLPGSRRAAPRISQRRSRKSPRSPKKSSAAMAKRIPDPHQKVDAKRPDVGRAASDDADRDEHFVVFKIAGDSFGFRVEDVSEIIRLPGLAKMPLGPRSLLGLANLRGVILPVIALRHLLHLPELLPDETTRVIVIARGASVGFVVDRIDNLLALPTNRLEGMTPEPVPSIPICWMVS